MKLKERIAARRAGGLGWSVEVRHAKRGIARMMRRGLHGAKNWVLEPDDDGLPRGPKAKLGRLLLVLLPLWVVLSAATGGPERGGQQASVAQAVQAAALLAVAELAFFSARERRLGREEPWAALPDLITESDADPAETLVAPPPENPADAFAKPQVSEVRNGEEPCNPEDITPNGGEITQSDIESLRDPSGWATPETPTIPLPSAELHNSSAAGEAVQQATFPATNRDESGQAPSVTATLDPEAPTQVLPDPLSERTFPQVSLVKEGLPKGGGPAGFPAPEPDPPVVTESSATPEVAPEAGALHKPLPTPPPPLETVQVTPVAPGLQEPLPGVVLAEEYARPGPYEPTEDPIAEDWWWVPPDLPEDAAVSPAAEPEPGEPEPGEAAPVEPEGAEEPEEPYGHIPDEAKAYRLAAFDPRALPEEKRAARRVLVKWARGEIDAGRRSQADIARLAGVDKSTVTRWLSKDDRGGKGSPWE